MIHEMTKSAAARIGAAAAALALILGTPAAAIHGYTKHPAEEQTAPASNSDRQTRPAEGATETRTIILKLPRNSASTGTSDASGTVWSCVPDEAPGIPIGTSGEGVRLILLGTE